MSPFQIFKCGCDITWVDCGWCSFGKISDFVVHLQLQASSAVSVGAEGSRPLLVVNNVVKQIQIALIITDTAHLLTWQLLRRNTLDDSNKFLDHLIISADYFVFLPILFGRSNQLQLFWRPLILEVIERWNQFSSVSLDHPQRLLLVPSRQYLWKISRTMATRSIHKVHCTTSWTTRPDWMHEVRAHQGSRVGMCTNEHFRDGDQLFDDDWLRPLRLNQGLLPICR